jgi:hypothetical protein
VSDHPPADRPLPQAIRDPPDRLLQATRTEPRGNIISEMSTVSQIFCGFWQPRRSIFWPIRSAHAIEPTSFVEPSVMKTPMC